MKNNRMETGRLVFVVTIPAKCPSLNKVFGGKLRARIRLKRELKAVAKKAIATALSSSLDAGGTMTLTICARSGSSTSSDAVPSFPAMKVDTLNRWS